MKTFNLTGTCIPERHYMVDLSEKADRIIRDYIDQGAYFTINRARQFGKTTLLSVLQRKLSDRYLVIRLSFEGVDEVNFSDSVSFVNMFRKNVTKRLSRMQADRHILDEWNETLEGSLTAGDKAFDILGDKITALCGSAGQGVLLFIDEVDKYSDNQVFLNFLGLLRNKYLDMQENLDLSFQSVVLASVYDVKNLKLKLRPDEGKKYNSPWNIAADFLVDMSFSPKEIAGMLREYECDHHTGMDIDEISGFLYDYTSGYPYLVSRLCKLMDERVEGKKGFLDKSSAWTREGFLEAVKMLLTEKNTLFESLTGKLQDYPELRDVLYLLLFQGQAILYNPDDGAIDVALMFGFVKVYEGMVVVANRIFETRLYNQFLLIPELKRDAMYRAALLNRNRFIRDGRLDMRLILEKFAVHFDDIFGDRGERFVEEDGRRYFLLYLKPIINGVGNYYIEAQTRNMERTDIIVDYGGEQFIVETKIWRGNAYHTRGEEQLTAYLDHYHLKKGYMLSFNFNKKKEIGIKEIVLGDKVIIEAVV